MSNDEIRQLDQAIAEALGPEWTAEIKCLHDWRPGFPIIARADGPALFTHHDGGRISVGGEHPAGNHNRHSGYPPPSITVAISRGPTAIAREIARRYLPAYLAWYAHAVEQDAGHDRNEAKRIAMLHAMAAVLGGKARKSANGRSLYYDGEASFSTTVDVDTGGCADIKVSGAPADLAIVLLRVVREYEHSHAEAQASA